MSVVLNPLASAVDALSKLWEDVDAYAFPPAAILDKVVEKLQDCNMQEDHSDHSRVEKYALVLESSGNVQQITQSPPNLLTKHRSLTKI